jgi:hypothetical protein
MDYRVYLAGSDGHFRAFSVFSAQSDREGQEIALALYGNCSTSFHAIELWRGAKLVMRRTRDQTWPKIDLRELVAKRQESVAQLEETLERSFICVRESRQLMDALDKIRSA